ncbi:MAG: pyridoxamine 5'-phosphate oxidase family protein [Burkholderiales bacterium]
MSKLYGATQRAFQDRFDTRRLADKIDQVAVAQDINDMNKAFIESRDMFWLSTVDENGRPTVSYKGGDPGFVKVVDSKTIAFPLYDGNGMFFSAGNIAGHAKVGMLFMDFERPNRLRVHGVAKVSENDPLAREFLESVLVVRVTVEDVFPNCPRYVHRMQKVKPSKYVPRAQCQTPIAGWKNIDLLQGDLPAKDQERARKEGVKPISIEAWFGKVIEGSEEA